MQLDDRSRGMTLSEMASSTSVKRDSQQQQSASAMHAGDGPAADNGPSPGGAASRILDNLLGDMLAILEDSEEDSQDDEDGESSDADSSISSSTPSANENTLKAPHNATSPAPSEREEGEVESEEDLRLKQQRKLLAQGEAEKREARRIAREEEKKKSIERNVSQRDVFRYLKKNGFPTKLLNDFTQACISKSDTNGPASVTSTSQQPEGTSDVDGASGPSKEDIHKLSSKHSFKHLLHKAEKAKESKDAIGRLLDTCTTIVAEEEAAQEKVAQRQKNTERIATQQKQVIKGNYTGRKHLVDRGTATDPVVNTIPSAQAGPPLNSATTTHTHTSQATKPGEASTARNNRLPTPTSPTRNTAVLAVDNNDPTRTENRSSTTPKDMERAAKAAKFVARFQHVLNSRQLNFTRQDLEKYNIRQPSSRAITTSSSATATTSSTANHLPGTTHAPLHPALNGIRIASSSSSSEPVLQLTSTDVEKDGRASRQNGVKGSFKAVGSASDSTGRTHATTSSSRIIQGSNGTGNTASSITMSKTTVGSTSTDSASSSSANAKSIYDLIPENVLRKKKSPHAYNSSLPSHEDTSMQVDEMPSQPTTSTFIEKQKDSTTAQTSHNPTVNMSLALPSAGIPGREKEKPTDKSDVGMWFGSSETQDGAYSPIETRGAPRGRSPAPHRIPSLPPSTAVPTSGMRPFRTSMSPPPSNRGRHGSAHSPPPPPSHSPPPPPPSITSSLPPPPSHLPARPRSASKKLSARPVSPVERLPTHPVSASEHDSNNTHYPARPITNPEKLKAMFPTSFHKPTALPKKAHTYNEVTSSNEAVPLVQKQSKGLDPRMIAAERMKMLREKERDSENSDKEKAGSSLPSATLPKQSTVSVSGIQPGAGTTILTQGQKDAIDSSASPDCLFKGPDAMDDHGMDFSASDDQGAQQDERAFSPPPLHTKAQQAANAKMPLPSFRRAGQVTGNTLPSTEKDNSVPDDEKQKKELELKNRLKRARDENSNTPSKDTSNKRQAREVTSTTDRRGTSSRTAKDASPPLPTSIPKSARGLSAQTAPPDSALSSARKLVNSAGRRASEMHKQHAIEDDEDEEEAVAVAPSRTDKPSPPKKNGVVPVVEVQVPSSRQGSIASTISAREGSVVPRVGGSGKPKSVVARKSTGGFRQKVATPSGSASTTTARPSIAPDASAPAPPKEGIKVTLKLGGGRTATSITHREAPARSSGSKGAPSNATQATQKPLSSKASRTVIEIDDSSDDTDDTDKDDDIPLRKAPVTVKKAVATSSSATLVTSPPSSVNKSRPRARPLAGSGTRLSDIGLSQSPARVMRSSSTDEEAPPPAWSQAKLNTEKSASSDSTTKETQAPLGSSKNTASSGKETSLPASNLSSSQFSKRPATPPVSTVPSLATAKNVEDQPPVIMSSPPMPQRDSLSPPFDEQDADEVIPDSESEAYSPSQMPRYSLSPVPDADNLELPSGKISPPVQETTTVQTKIPVEDNLEPLPKTSIPSQPEASLNPPPMPMTQVASSQSPEDSQMLRSVSEAALQFEDQVDMLASDGEDNALAEDLLNDTLDDLPDLPVVPATVPLKVTLETQETSTNVTSNAEGSVAQTEETVSISTTVRRSNEEPMAFSTQKPFVDPMDLSQAFGDRDDDEDEEDELQSPPQDQKSGQANMQSSTIRNQQYLRFPQESQQMVASTAGSPTMVASFLEETHQRIVEDDKALEQIGRSTPITQEAPAGTSSENKQQSRRATASDFMAAQVLPPRGEFTEAYERTPVFEAAKLPAQTQKLSDIASTFTSPVAPPSEAESFEIIMDEQSPMQSFTGNSGPFPASETSQHARSTLEALDKPLEEPFTRCRWNTGCLDMNCTFAHPSPSLHSRWATNTGALPRQKKECPDAVFCSNPACILSHPSPAARRKEICVNQANCPYGVKCIFRHVDEGSSQLTRRYQSHNQSTRFTNSPVVSNAPAQMARQHLSPPPTIVPGTTTTHAGTQVSSSTLPFLSYHPMPPIPPGSTPPLSRSASPAVNVSNTAGPSTSSIGGSDSAYPHASHFQPEQQSPQSHIQQLRTMQQPQQTRQQGPHRSWTSLGGAAGAASSAAGWLANKAGLSKGS